MSINEYMLDNWVTLNSVVMDLEEAQVKALLDLEREGQRRPAFLLRLYGRYNTLRTRRERSELLMD